MKNQILLQLKSIADKDIASNVSRYFKTGKNEYSENDVFLGITAPKIRKIAKEYIEIDLDDLKNIMRSIYHEARLLSVIILVNKFEKGNNLEKEIIYKYFLDNIDFVNNWDIVDSSAPKIIGRFLLKHTNRSILYDLIKDESLWKRRIAILSTFTLIKNNDFFDILKLAEMVLNDNEDLIHKATGWMLREVGKLNKDVLIKFLNLHIKKMPRTMLRYSIEKFSKEKRA